MKILRIIATTAGILFLALGLIFLTLFSVIKNIKIKDLIENEIEEELGIPVTIEKLGFSPLMTHIWVQGVTIHNPAGFDDQEMAYLNSLHLIWDPGEMLVRQKPNIYLVGIDITRLNVVKNRKGEVNINDLLPIKDADDASKDPTPFAIDVLVLSIEKLTYTEEKAGGRKTSTYTIGMKNQTFVNLQDENEVIKLIVSKAIQNTDIAKLVHLTVSPVLSGARGTLGAAWGTARSGVKSAVDIAAMPFKMLFSK